MTIISFLLLFSFGQSVQEEGCFCPAGTDTEWWLIAGQSNTHCGRVTEAMTQASPDIWMLKTGKPGDSHLIL